MTKALKWLFSFVLAVTLLLPFSCTSSNTKTVTVPSGSPSPVKTSSSPMPSGTTELPEITFTFPTGTDLEFETVVIAREPYDKNAPIKAEIQVLINKPEFPAKGVLAIHQSKVTEVDFSRYLVLILFMGSSYPYSEGIEVQRIVQTKNTINILAQFPKPQKTVVPGITYPYHIIKVNKDSLTQIGDITFILFNQWGKERATATYEIQQ